MSIASVAGLLFALISIENAALSIARSDMLYFSSGSQLLVISRDPSVGATVACSVYNKGSVEYDTNMAEAGSFVVTASEELMADLMRNCIEFNHYGPEIIKALEGKRQFVIFPGTKWCGIGNRAKNDSDVGEYIQTDRCCRTHDKCDIFISAFEAKYNLFNYALYTIVGCDCDEKFRDCLVAAGKSPTTAEKDKSTANTMGKLFFNVISPKCLQQDYPRICIKQGWWGKCAEYKSDTTKTKVWKFEDSYLRYPS